MSATRPDFFNPTEVVANEKVNKGATDEERHLHNLSQMMGWKILKEYAQDLLEGLKATNKQAMAQGLPLEEIGRNAIVMSLVEDQVKAILNRVEDAREACEKPDGSDR